MATILEKLYSIIENSKDLELELTAELIRKINETEESIIREEILPIIGKDIEPTLSQIKRDLVLVVEYHPGEPISVALSRKMKINQITDAKTITPTTSKAEEPIAKDKTVVAPKPKTETSPKQVKNASKGLRVRFPNGTIVCHNKAIDTYKEVLCRIGLQRVHNLGLTHAGYNLVGKKQRQSDKSPMMWQHKVGDWYIYVNLSNGRKMHCLKAISDELHLGLRIDVVE